MRVVLRPKPCPKRAQNEGASKAPVVSGAASCLTQSHRSELNRRPLLSLKVAISGISRQLKDITRRITAFLARQTAKSPPETVPKPCLAAVTYPLSHTNLIRQNRFTPQAQADLERAVRDELRQFQFRRWS